MPVIIQKEVSTEDLVNNPEVLYLYPENEAEMGGSPFSREIRGEDNAVGVRVKRAPNVRRSSFYTIDELPEACNNIDEDLEPVIDHLKREGVVVIKDASFDVLSLDKFSPDIQEYIDEQFAYLRSL